MRNVTVTMREEVVRAAKHLAVDRGVSLSKLLEQLIEAELQATEDAESKRRDEDYRDAMQRALAMMGTGFPLGLGEKIPWSRDELHER